MSGTEVITRRARAGRERDDDDEVAPGVTIEQPDQISPEDALAESRRQLQASQQQTAEARRQAREAQQTAQRAAQQTQEATAARISDREVAVNSVLESVKAEISTAKAAYRLAREAGDVDGEIAAQEMLAGATVRMHNASAEIERIKATPKPEVQRRQQQDGPQISPEAQAWLDTHPAYFQDDEYQALAHVGDKRAIAAGHEAGSQAYVDFIDRFLETKYGEGHGQVEERQAQQQSRQRQQPTGDGIPPSRHAGGTQGARGYKSVKTDLGEIQYRTGAGGKIENMRFPGGIENFRDGAEFTLRSLYEKDPDAAIVAYAQEFIDDHLEGSETIRHGDGRILR